MTVNLQDDKEGKIYLQVRRVQKNAQRNVVLIHFVNELRFDEKSKQVNRAVTEATVFQPYIRVNMDEGTELESLDEWKKDEILSYLYRDKQVLARGFMCSAVWRGIDYASYVPRLVFWADGTAFTDCAEFLEPHVRTEFLPMYATPSPVFDWQEEKYGRKPELSASRLAEAWNPEQIEGLLTPLISAFETWIGENEKKAQSMAGGPTETRALDVINHEKKTLERLREGMRLLAEDEDARLAFCFANYTMFTQREWKRPGSDFVWRPFQLAFILMNLGPLRSEGSVHRDLVDLLWIPTGGGKTETYLALMAYAISLRRILAAKKRSDGKSGQGTTVITRYTLRLLTVQQFRRTLDMVTAAEYLRVLVKNGHVGWRPARSKIVGDWLYGTTRISCGMWVGGEVTPNHLRKKGYSALERLEEAGTSKTRGEPAQVLACPACRTILSVPFEGLPPGTQTTMHLIAKSTVQKTPKDIEKDLKGLVGKIEFLRNIVSVGNEGLSGGYVTITVELDPTPRLKERDIDRLWNEIIADIPYLEIASFRASRPGYFGSGRDPGWDTKKKGYLDFQILCPNPGCVLNTSDISYRDEIPFSSPLATEATRRHGKHEAGVEAFAGSHRLPIPAYTVDEQIYSKCPSVVVSTADKIARLSFEPRASAIFGNVNRYNPHYGYHRENLYPANTTPKGEAASVGIQLLEPPDLIVQDELHLIDGPLGSMFGLYETVVEGLSGGSNSSPKYIASTATARRVDSQVRRLFARELNQFPAYGLDMDDNFFVRTPKRHEALKDDRPGRIYIGLCTPGLGPNTPMSRVWSRILCTSDGRKGEKDAVYYWTIVGYFNTIKGLGNTRALYRENVVERLRNIGSSRNLDMDNIEELSSRMSSTKITQILGELENGVERSPEQNIDALFTTSMFGTGVDTRHLSLMLVDGQPKTTSQYIQATGRVGREYGGVVLTFLRPTRPRDLSHYEMFTGYHHRIHLDVEPPSVSPFSKGALIRAAGPVAVAFLRNSRSAHAPWHEDSGDVILHEGASQDTDVFLKTVISNRLGATGHGNPLAVTDYFRSEIGRWQVMARNNNMKGGTFDFAEYAMYRPPESDVVLGDIKHRYAGKKIVFENAPQSLREIEETTAFEV